MGGAVIGALLGGTRVRALALRVAALVIVAIVIVVALQTLGYAQAPVLTH